MQRGNLSISDYYQRAKTLADTLAAIGQPLQDFEVVSYILGGLDSTYVSLVTSITTRVDPISLEDLFSHLLSHEQRIERNHATLNIPFPSANAATRSSHSRGRNTRSPPHSQSSHQGPSYHGHNHNHGRGHGRNVANGNSHLICQVCKKPGHIALTCYHRFDHSFQGVSPNIATFVAGPPSQFDANWYPYSGSTNHLTPDLNNLNLHAEEYQGPDQIRIGDGTGLDIKHIGSSKLLTSSTTFPLKHVLHVPDIQKNLVSVSQFTRDHDVFIEFHANYFCVKDETTGRLLLRGRCEHGLYPFPASFPSHDPLKPFLEYVFLLMYGTVALDILLISLFNALSPVSHYQLSRIKLMLFMVLVNKLKASSFPFMILLFIPMLMILLFIPMLL